MWVKEEKDDGLGKGLFFSVGVLVGILNDGYSWYFLRGPLGQRG